MRDSLYYLSQMKTGERIKELCDEKKIGIKVIVKYLSISERSVYSWFNGDKLPTIDNLYLLSVLLNVTMDDLLVGYETEAW